MVKRGFLVSLAVVVCVFVFAGKVYAAEEYITVKYFSGAGMETREERIELIGSFTESQKAFFIFANLFDDALGVSPAFIPKGVKLLGAEIEGGVLTLDVSPEITSYGGGTAYEGAMLDIITKNAVGIGGVKYITLTTGGETVNLPEGSNAFRIMVNKAKS